MTTARVSLTQYIDAGSRWRHQGETGEFWVEQVFLSPIGWREWEVGLRGPACKADGSISLLRRNGKCTFAELPEFVRQKFVEELHQTIDRLKQYTRVAQHGLPEEASRD